MSILTDIGARSKSAQKLLAKAGSAAIDRALNAVADALEREAEFIIAENKRDIEAGEANGLSKALIDRLSLNEARIGGMAQGLRQVAAGESPVGKVLWGEVRPNGMKIEKVAVPIGVIAVIFEARPNVTADAAAICLKAGNSVILKGGKEAINSNKAIADVMRKAVAGAGLPEPHKVVTPEDIVRARSVVSDVYMDEKIEKYIVDIIFATREPQEYGLGKLAPMISYGASPRASIALAKASKAYAFIKHRGYVIPEDVRAMCHDVLRHRIGLSYEAEAESVTTEDIITDILNAVEVP